MTCVRPNHMQNQWYRQTGWKVWDALLGSLGNAQSLIRNSPYQTRPGLSLHLQIWSRSRPENSRGVSVSYCFLFLSRYIAVDGCRSGDQLFGPVFILYCQSWGRFKYPPQISVGIQSGFPGSLHQAINHGTANSKCCLVRNGMEEERW